MTDNCMTTMDAYNILYTLLEIQYGDCWDDDPEDRSVFCVSCIVKRNLDDLKEAIDED